MRKAVRYGGRVQGVGFRATVRSLARDLNVTGWVRNEPDGTVRLEVQGEPDQVAALLGRVRRSLGGFIRTESGDEISATAGESGFVIAH